MSDDSPLFFVRQEDAHPGHLTVVQPVAAFAEPPEWAPFLPIQGQYTHPIYGAMDFSAERYERIVANFKAGVYQERIPVNAEHDVMSSGAVGWITDMRLAEDGSIEAKVEWNERGRTLIKDDRYKYVSAEWFDVWTDPVSGEAIPDVAVGLALTTRPYFKESVLRPLAASEAVLTRVIAGTPGEAGDPGKEIGMPDEATIQTPAVEPSTATETAAPQPDPVVRQLDEAAAKEFAELKRNARRLEEENKKLSEERARLMAESRTKRFTAEVRGASEANGTAYIGDIADHVQMLCDLEESFGANSQQVRFYMEQNRAHAEQMEKSTLFREMGTGRSSESATPTYDQIEAMAREAATRTPGKTYAQAFSEVLETNPELKSALARERQGGR